MSFKDIYRQIPIEQRYQYIKDVNSKFVNNISATAKFLGISYNTVKKAVNTNEIIQRKYTEKLQNPHKIYIYSQTINKPSITAQELRDLLYILFDLKVSESTINRYRKKANLRYRPPLRSVYITENAKNLRKNFTDKHLTLNTNFNNVVFSDESAFQLGAHKKWVWVDKYNITTGMLSHDRKYYPKIMIWGAVGYNFKSSLVIFEGHVNSEKYINDIFFGTDLLEAADNHWGVDGWVFQQDNAPSHTSNVTKAVLSELSVKLLEDWPPYSPDLNIIETIWAIMKSRIEKKSPQTLDDLKKIIIDVWEALTFETINGLIDTMHERLISVNEHPERSYYHSY